MIPLFDHHIHMDARNASDYELMALAGVEKVMVPCSFTGERKYGRESFAERFDKLINMERGRASHFGIDLSIGLAVNAADIGSHAAALGGVEEVAARLARPHVGAVGELALRKFSREEVEIFERQLELARDHGLPAMVEAPPGMNGFRRLLKVLGRSLDAGKAEPDRVCLVDLNFDKLELAHGLGLGGYGIPVSPKVDGIFCVHEKQSHADVMRMVETFGSSRLMLNSALHFGFADVLCFPKTVLRLKLAGMDLDTLSDLAFTNAERFFFGHAS